MPAAPVGNPPAWRVLVVDDDIDCAEELAELLGCIGCLAEVATSPAEARACVARERFDLALVDLHLGTDSGLTLVADWAHGAGPRVVVISGRALRADEQARIGANPPFCLTKPVDMARVEAVLAALPAREGGQGIPTPGRGG